MIRRYSDLVQLQTFDERYQYLRLVGEVGKETFGFDRYLNQRFYRSVEWKRVCNAVILRDEGCDLGMANHEIVGKILIHHMNPIGVNDIANATDILLNPEFLICTSFDTHNAIHYGLDEVLTEQMVIRTMNDTCPWKK